MGEMIKRGFYIPVTLADFWERFHAPSKDYSPSAAAGMLLYMACDMPNLRESVRKLAMEKDVKKAVAKTRELLVRTVRQAEILERMADVDDGLVLRLLEAAKKEAAGGP